MLGQVNPDIVLTSSHADDDFIDMLNTQSMLTLSNAAYMHIIDAIQWNLPMGLCRSVHLGNSWHPEDVIGCSDLASSVIFLQRRTIYHLLPNLILTRYVLKMLMTS